MVNCYTSPGQQSGSPAYNCVTDVSSVAEVCSGPCTPGHFCPEGSIAEKPCEAGHYCPDGKWTTVHCNALQYRVPLQSIVVYIAN